MIWQQPPLSCKSIWLDIVLVLGNLLCFSCLGVELGRYGSKIVSLKPCLWDSLDKTTGFEIGAQCEWDSDSLIKDGLWGLPHALWGDLALPECSLVTPKNPSPVASLCPPPSGFSWRRAKWILGVRFHSWVFSCSNWGISGLRWQSFSRNSPA